MTINFSLKNNNINSLITGIDKLPWVKIILAVALVLSLLATWFSFSHDVIVSYGDAESHLNIAKRVVSSLTPGLAQLGGIWLPLPHLLMVPFVYFDSLWRTGLAGSIVSGISFIIASVFIYKLTCLVTNNKIASLIAFLVFASNPNILYLQSTPMTELPLIMFFILSGYFLIKYLLKIDYLISLILAAFFGFCASLTRYDGWFLVTVESLIVFFASTKIEKRTITKIIGSKGEALFILFSTLAFIGIVGWIAWDFLILGDPLYFTSSQFSAKSQQLGWLAKHQLPAYHNLPYSLLYYIVTSMSAVGIIIYGITLAGLTTLIKNRKQQYRYILSLIILIPFLFYVLTLYIGQSMIFIPHITPISFEWRLFNVRYGIMMVPAAAFLSAYLFNKVKTAGKFLIIFLLFMQLGLYAVGYSKVITYEDGTVGLSSSRRPDAERWMAKNYDTGLVLMDDYSRIFSVIRTKIPMQNIIYIGNKPYWEESLKTPQKYANWIIIQKGDTIWKTFYDTPEKQGILYTYYKKVYTSEEILIFKKI